MVMNWIVAATPMLHAVVGFAASTEGIVTLTGFYWVVYQALFGGAVLNGGGGALLGGLNNAVNNNNGGAGGGGPLVRFARPIQLLLTLTLLGLFFKWPLTSTLFVALWIGILAYTNLPSAFLAAVTGTSSTATPSNSPILGASEELLPTSLVDAVTAAAASTTTTTTSRLPGWSPWMWLGLIVIGSWILCALMADLLEDSARTIRRTVKRTIRYLLWTAPRQFGRFVVRSVVKCIQLLYRSVIRPTVHLGVHSIRRGIHWIRERVAGNHQYRHAEADDDAGANLAPPTPPARRWYPRHQPPVDGDLYASNNMNGRAPIVINGTGSQDDDEQDETTSSGGGGAGSDGRLVAVQEPLVETLINYWRDPSNKPYWDDNDDEYNDDDYDDDHNSEEEEQDEEDDHNLSMDDFVEEEEVDVTPRRSSRLWERGL